MPEKRILKYDDGCWLEQDYEGEKLHGNWTVFYADGSKKFERQYEHDLKHGYCRQWNNPGQLLEEEWNYLDERHGPWRKWDEQGNEIDRLEYYFGYRRDLVEASQNPDFQELLRPKLGLAPSDFVPLMAEVLQRWSKPTVLMGRGMLLSKADPTRRSFWNWVDVLGERESWPSFQGKPLSPIWQIKCDEVSLREHPLAEFSYVTMFSLADTLPDGIGHGLEIRTYRPDDVLVPAKSPVKPIQPPRILDLSQVRDSYPNPNDLPVGLRVLINQHQELRPLFEPDFRFDSRIGGWPAWLQWGNLLNYGPFAFQVDSCDIEGWRTGDSAMHYFFRDPQGGFDWRDESM